MDFQEKVFHFFFSQEKLWEKTEVVNIHDQSAQNRTLCVCWKKIFIFQFRIKTRIFSVFWMQPFVSSPIIWESIGKFKRCHESVLEQRWKKWGDKELLSDSQNKTVWLAENPIRRTSRQATIFNSTVSTNTLLVNLSEALKYFTFEVEKVAGEAPHTIS